MKPRFTSTGMSASLLKIASAAGSLFLIFMFSGQAQAQQGYHFQWAHSAGGHEVSIMPTKPILDSQGNAYVLINYLFANNDTLFFDNGSGIVSNMNNTILAKYNPTGQLIWAKNIIVGDPYYLQDITMGKNDDIYLLGNFGNLITMDTANLISAISYPGSQFLAKFNTNGNVIWARKIVEPSDTLVFQGMSVDKTGNIYLGGSFQGHSLTLGAYTFYNSDSVSFGVGGNAGILSSDYVIAKYGGNGNVIWAKHGGLYHYHEGVSPITTDTNGNLYYVITQEHAWDIAIYDTSRFSFLIKSDTNGTLIWTDTFRGAWVNGITTDNKGDLYFMGPYGNVGILGNGVTFGDYGNYWGGGIYTAKANSEGEILWGKDGKSSPPDVTSFVNGLTVDKNGNVSISGLFVSGSPMNSLIFDMDTLHITLNSPLTNFQFSRDAFLVRYDTHGNLLEAKDIGGNLVDGNSGMAATPDGALYITGRYFSPIVDFDSNTLINNPVVNPDTLYYSRFYIAKYIPGTGNGNDTTNTIRPLTRKDLIIAFPNPTSGIIHLQTSERISVIRVINIIGQEIYHKVLDAPQKAYTIDLSKQPKGIYWIEVRSRKGASSEKVFLK